MISEFGSIAANDNRLHFKNVLRFPPFAGKVENKTNVTGL